MNGLIFIQTNEPLRYKIDIIYSEIGVILDSKIYLLYIFQSTSWITSTLEDVKNRSDVIGILFKPVKTELVEKFQTVTKSVIKLEVIPSKIGYSAIFLLNFIISEVGNTKLLKNDNNYLYILVTSDFEKSQFLKSKSENPNFENLKTSKLVGEAQAEPVDSVHNLLRWENSDLDLQITKLENLKIKNSEIQDSQNSEIVNRKNPKSENSELQISKSEKSKSKISDFRNSKIGKSKNSKLQNREILTNLHKEVTSLIENIENNKVISPNKLVDIVNSLTSKLDLIPIPKLKEFSYRIAIGIAADDEVDDIKIKLTNQKEIILSIFNSDLSQFDKFELKEILICLDSLSNSNFDFLRNEISELLAET